MAQKAIKGSEVTYYGRIAGWLRSAKYITLVITMIYLLLTIAIYRSELTIENFRYLIKYFDSSSTEQTGGLKNYRDIYFDATSEIMLGLYSSDLAVVKSDSVNIYNMLGNNTLSYTINFRTPVLLTSDKYMLTYALGEYSYTINNSFSQLFAETLDYPITGAALSDSGMYAIATRTLEYKGAVIVYDDSFEPVSRILKDKYILDVDMTDDGDELLVASVYVENAQFTSEIMTSNPYSEKARATIRLEDTMVVRARYNSSGGYSVICDDRLLFYDADDKLLSEISFDGNMPTNYMQSEEYTVIVRGENVVGSRSNVLIFTNDGELLHECTIDGRIIDIESDEKNIYVLFENSIACIDPTAGKTMYAELESGCLALVIKENDVLLVCYTNRASAYSTNDLFDPYKTDDQDGEGDEVTTDDTTQNETEETVK